MPSMNLVVADARRASSSRRKVVEAEVGRRRVNLLTNLSRFNDSTVQRFNDLVAGLPRCRPVNHVFLPLQHGKPSQHPPVPDFRTDGLGKLVKTRQPLFLLTAMALMARSALGAESAILKDPFDAKARAHWAFQKVTRPS